MGYEHRGDYLAGEPPIVDTDGYYPDEAPYPRSWSTQQRLDMTWYATRYNIRVDYDPSADDEGASGWNPAISALLRDRATRTAAVRVAVAGGPIPEPEPVAAPDPSEPRHPRAEYESW
jgi:hypothetical protein